MKPVEMLWRKTAARDRFQMRASALLWRETGEPAFLTAAIACRNLYHCALATADEYASKRGQR